LTKKKPVKACIFSQKCSLGLLSFFGFRPNSLCAIKSFFYFISKDLTGIHERSHTEKRPEPRGRKAVHVHVPGRAGGGWEEEEGEEQKDVEDYQSDDEAVDFGELETGR
jgi:hypothetical protein